MSVFLLIVGWCFIAGWVVMALIRRIGEVAHELAASYGIPVLRDVIEDGTYADADS